MSVISILRSPSRAAASHSGAVSLASLAYLVVHVCGMVSHVAELFYLDADN